jgi:hypothetical protein
MGTADDDLERRIARIHDLLEAMRVTAADARDEALAATEQLLMRARKSHNAAAARTRTTRSRVLKDRVNRQRRRRG